MDENKNLENVQDVAEEVTETVEETVEEIAEEAVEETPEVEEVTEDAEVPAEEIVEAAVEAPKKSKAGAIIAGILVVAIIAAAAIVFMLTDNKYNRMGYVDISGKTVQDLADQMGVSLEEFLKQYELPADMPANTTESAAYYNIPVRVMAQMFGMDYATMKETLKFPETVTEDTTWGEAEGEVTLRDYVGEENFEGFKEEYGFGEEVTLDTKWKEVRKTVDTAQKEARIEQEKAAAEAEKAAEQEGEAETEVVEGDVATDDVAETPEEEPAEEPAE